MRTVRRLFLCCMLAELLALPAAARDPLPRPVHRTSEAARDPLPRPVHRASENVANATSISRTGGLDRSSPTATFPTPWCRNWYTDCDADGYGDPATALYTCRNPNIVWPRPACPYVKAGGDCDDADATLNPGAEEGPAAPDTTTDGIDNDCDGFVDIDCDGTSLSSVPEISITSPARGYYASSSSATVRGLALPGQDRSPVQSVTVEGIPAALTACSEDGGALFEATVPLRQGVQTLDIIAEDELARADKALTSIAYSDRYINLSNTPVHGALVSLLNQGSWNIMGDWLEGYYSAAEIQSQLFASNPILNESGDADCIENYTIYANATGYTHDSTEVTFTVTGGRIVVTARLVHPQLWASGYGYYDLEWYCGGWSDTVNMNAYMSFSEVYAAANGWLSLDANGQVIVTFTDVWSSASGAHIDISADDWYYDWIIDLFEGELEDELEQFVEEELYSYVAYDLGPDLAEELNSLDLSYTVDIGGIPYGVSFTYDTLQLAEGSVPLGFKMGLSYTKDARTPANPGAIGEPTNYQLDVSPTLGFEIGEDFFNGAMHAMWEGGSLYLNEQLWNDPLITGTSTPLLPPVIVPGSSPYLLELDIGDLIADLSVQTNEGPISVRAALASSVAANLTPMIDGSTIWFDVVFAPAEVSYDVLGAVPIPAELVEASEEAMGVLMDQVLLELEAYLESLRISFYDIPMSITGLTIGADPANPAMNAIDMNAVYVGP